MYLQCKYIVSKINYYANFSRAPLGPENSLHLITKKAQSRARPCAILQISVYKRRLVGTDNKLSKHCSVRIISDELRDATAFT